MTAAGIPVANASATSPSVEYLRSPLAIRARCESILQAGLDGKLQHFAVNLERLQTTAERVVAVTKAAYPTLAIPVHGRMNHFRAGGVDRVASINAQMSHLSADDKARAWIDLVMVSVLLDAGAGDVWKFDEAATGQKIGRSEGLAVASLYAFAAGLFSDGDSPLRVDASALQRLDAQKLSDAFQVSADNPLEGRDGRIELVKQLGYALSAAPHIFPNGRPGGLLDSLRLRTRDGKLAAPDILASLLEGLATIWPGRVVMDGVNLGDVWRHHAAGGTGPTAGLVPFHKLSQWLAYSLFEPLEMQGIVVEQAGALTGLPEYRNGGLLLDMGVLVAKHDDVVGRAHRPDDEVIVEWRALTVALLDRLADPVRKLLGKTPEQLPLACILEGGTWATGRAVAAERRAGGGPPIRIISDGTVF
jgi:hypothetical protein